MAGTDELGPLPSDLELPEELGISRAETACYSPEDPVESQSPSESELSSRFRLVEHLGEGAMGEVWLARQDEPVRRAIAVKIIKRGMDSKTVVARFQAERQALAIMDHPGIAKVFDAGCMEDGRPYFAMEYIEGLPITTYCDRNRLDLTRRLRLFQAVCSAVQHAHQKAVIHRDLKPSNILVTEQDGEAVPKVIDFGIAKATAYRLTENTLHTAEGMMVGTPEYMSPEQADGAIKDIDTRSDIYSLGVVLYQLLIGALPFDAQLLRGSSLTEIQRIIREEDPPRPSRRLDSADAARDVAATRATEPSKLHRELRGDLDWITLKAMDKDRSRRYPSAAELSADVGRYLDGEAVLARPPSRSYRLRKLVGRHRLAVGAGALVLLALSVFTAVALLQADRLARERDRAAAEAVRSAQIGDFLDRMLSAPDPWSDQSLAQLPREVRVVDVLDQASREVGRSLAAQPDVEAAVRTTLGRSYRNLGFPTEAQRQLETALDSARRHLGDSHPTTLDAMENLALVYDVQARREDAAKLLEEAIESRRLMKPDAELFDGLRHLAMVRQNQGDYPAAEELLLDAEHQARSLLGDEHEQVLGLEQQLASLYWRQGRLDDAERLASRNVETYRRVVGEDHPDTLASVNQLGLVYQEQGRYREAEALNLANLEAYRRVLGEDHPHSLVTVNNLGVLYDAEGRLDDAERWLRQAVELDERVLGADHPWTLNARGNLARVLMQLERFDEAEEAFDLTLPALLRTLGKNHVETLRAQNNLAGMYRRQGRWTEAEALYAELVPSLREVMPEGFFGTGAALAGWGDCLTRLGRYEAAETKLLSALGILEQALGGDHERTIATRGLLVELYEAWGRPDKATALTEVTGSGSSPEQ